MAMADSESESDSEQPTDWVEQSDIGHTASKQNGNDAEQWVRTHYKLDPQNSDICPEHAHDAVDPRTGTPIEIKSCQIRYAGTGGRGRFQIWDYAHSTLLQNGGVYVFVVHEPRSTEFHVYLHRPLAAGHVDELIRNWNDIDHQLRPGDAKRTSLCQSAVFTDIQVQRIEHPEQAELPTDIEESQETEHEQTERTRRTPPTGEDPRDQPERIPQVERVKETKQAIREIEEQHSDDVAPHGVVIAHLRSEGIEESTAEHHIQELKKRGEIYMPRDGAYRVT